MPPSSPQFFGTPLLSQYADLGDAFCHPTPPTPVKHPHWITVNMELTEQLGMDPNAIQEGLEWLSGNRVIEHSHPIAQAYSGHQFGHFNPQLGDGRAVLLGEIQAPSGEIYDVQLKGSGPTVFSRNGDGRSAIGPVVRETIVSEAMHALGIPTTRALAAVASGEQVFRQDVVPGAVFTRVARSHLRVGTFEYFFSRGQVAPLKTLADFAIQRHYPDVKQSDTPYSDFLKCFATALAKLVCQWMRVGFIHGVMNTDNTAISGETLDYGPCAFLDEYHPNKVFSSIDRDGRYAFANQPDIAMWNLARLADCLKPLIEEESTNTEQTIEEALRIFSEQFGAQWGATLGHKLGIVQISVEQDQKLIEELFRLMQQDHVDYTVNFRLLTDSLPDLLSSTAPTQESLTKLTSQFPSQKEEFQAWLLSWQSRVRAQNESLHTVEKIMAQTNPIYIPRNHIVENVIQAAQNGNYQPMQKMMAVLKNPYQEQPGMDYYKTPPQAHERIQQTFCGT